MKVSIETGHVGGPLIAVVKEEPWRMPCDSYTHRMTPEAASALAMDLAQAVVEVDPVWGSAVLYGTGFRGDDGRSVDPRIVVLHDDGTWSKADEGER